MRKLLVLYHADHVPLGMAAEVFAEEGLALERLDLHRTCPDRLPLEGMAGLVVLGGPMNVDQVERYPFLGPEPGWIADAVERRIPYLGICLGGQLLAKAFGAKVYRNHRKEIGWYHLDLSDAAADDPLFAGLKAAPTVFEWHGDAFELPARAVRLAGTADTPNQAMRIGPCAWGLQFHVEMTPELMESWLAEPGFAAELKALPYVDPAEIRRQALQRFAPMTRVSRHLLGRFARYCQTDTSTS